MTNIPKHQPDAGTQSENGASGLYLTSGIGGMMSGRSAWGGDAKSPRQTIAAQLREIYTGIFSLNCTGNAMRGRN